MAEARQREQWTHTTELLSMIRYAAGRVFEKYVSPAELLPVAFQPANLPKPAEPPVVQVKLTDLLKGLQGHV